MEHEGRNGARRRTCQVRRKEYEAQSEGKKAGDGIRYVKRDNKTNRGPASGWTDSKDKKTWTEGRLGLWRSQTQVGRTELLGGCQRGHLKPLVSMFELFLACAWLVSGRAVANWATHAGAETRVRRGGGRLMGRPCIAVVEGAGKSWTTGIHAMRCGGIDGRLASRVWSCAVLFYSVCVEGLDGKVGWDGMGRPFPSCPCSLSAPSFLPSFLLPTPRSLARSLAPALP
ncbi:uncharacterized protein K460DRAFT_25497 [Cucurbitaria berberidis CBS 394.84]|uniref:Uncharacterized protein n=1 Tax=Cucurbitaria berberidis CBS 394.84 TaxID=1168544 RepID=A0A9P4GQS0_9PLEO|nr:uncharacterized protein K460DRAFT_25497 [Cucurbitaria berberidis CBS 394.84]KAF1850983.1 hypothetical protein K460DRAFT_25497 [Cucurbitaria berberidis CBS 394.84]